MRAPEGSPPCSARRGGCERVQCSGDCRGLSAQCVGIILRGETTGPLGNDRQIGWRRSGLKHRAQPSGQFVPSGSLGA